MGSRPRRVVPALEGFDGDCAVLADGARYEVASVLAATGSRPGHEPRVGQLGALDDQGSPLVHAAEQDPNAPGLHFLGYQVTLGGTFRQVGIEAEQLARAAARR
jgi:hypothetical protein